MREKEEYLDNMLVNTIVGYIFIICVIIIMKKPHVEMMPGLTNELTLIRFLMLCLIANFLNIFSTDAGYIVRKTIDTIVIFIKGKSHNELNELIESIEKSFFCEQCGDEVKISDYDYKDGHLYQSLYDVGKCEECARRG